MPQIRLQKLLSGWGLASRRNVEAMILAGRIRVDGKVMNNPGQRVDPTTARIEVDGQLIKPPSLEKSSVIIMFHKPRGVLSSMKDQFGRPTLSNYFRGRQRLYPIGRLDADSTGLLLMTNDGELTNRLLHPRYKVEKEYLVRYVGPPFTPSERKSFESGIELEDGLTAPCKLYFGFGSGITKKYAINFLGRQSLEAKISKHKKEYDDLAKKKKNRRSANNSLLGRVCRVILREGRKRQIKRMFAAFGRRVVALHRIRFGPIELKDLPPGKSRPINSTERHALLAAVGLLDTSSQHSEK